MKTRRMFTNAAATLAVFASLSALPTLAPATGDKAQLIFVQSAESFKADDKTLRLVNVSPQTIWFTDRPVRQAGHATMPN